MAQPSTSEAFLKKARERFARAAEAERDIRSEALKDLRFVAGQQWDERVRKDRDKAGRPALTVNRLPGHIAQIVNEERLNKPAIRINPVDNQADKDTAEVMQGMIRHIEYSSDADVAYQTAFEYAVSGSFGYFRVTTDYCDAKSFNQEIRIQRIADPFSVFFDPAAAEFDYSDADWAFVAERITREEFRERYPQAQAVSAGFYESSDNPAPDWIRQDGILIAEYWTVEKRRRVLQLLSDGSTIYRDQYDKLPEGVAVVRERDVEERQVRQSIINGVEVLEETDWPGQWIPIIPVLGKELYVEGQRKLFSLVRFARDPQLLYNYYTSSIAENVGLSPKAPWIGYKGQFKDQRWQDANLAAYAYLEVEPTMINGQVAPLPQRNQFEPPIQALIVGAMRAGDDIKAATGIYDASLGAKSNETSGKAILARQKEGDVGNFHFIDNLSRAQRHTGRILVDLIPKIYDTARQVRTIGEDESQKVVTVNQAYQDPDTGKPLNYRLGAGKYDVTVTTGPSFTTRRQEAWTFLTELGKNNEQLLAIAGDIVFRNGDMAGATELSERYKRFIAATNPGLVDDEKKIQIPPQVQAQLQQSQMMIEQLTQALNKATDDANSKRLEIDSRERIAALQVQADLIKTEAQVLSKENIELLKAEIAALKDQIGALRASEPAPAQ